MYRPVRVPRSPMRLPFLPPLPCPFPSPPFRGDALLGTQQTPLEHVRGVGRQSDLALHSSCDRHSPFIAAHTSSLGMQQPKLVLSQRPRKTLEARSQSAGREHNPFTASHAVVDDTILRPNGVAVGKK